MLKTLNQPKTLFVFNAIKVLLINLSFEGYILKPNAFEAMFGSVNKIDIKIDNIDKKIIEELQKNPSIPLNVLSKKEFR